MNGGGGASVVVAVVAMRMVVDGCVEEVGVIFC